MLRYSLLIAAAVLTAVPAHSEDLAPYGSSKSNLREYPVTNAVFDANFTKPEDLNTLYAFVKNTMGPLKGKMVVVTLRPRIARLRQGELRQIPGHDGQDEGAGRGLSAPLAG